MNPSPLTDRRFRLSALEFDVLAEHLGIDEMPLVLAVPSPGKTHSERAKLVSSAWRALSNRGAVGGGELDPDLAAMLRLIAEPAREVDARIWSGRSVRVLAAAENGGEHAVLAVKDGDHLTFSPTSALGLPRAAVSCLPEAPAGPGRSVSVPSDDLDSAATEVGDRPEQLPAALRRRGIRPDDADTLTDMVTGATTRGQFGAAARNLHGTRRRATRVVGFFDTPRGRYTQQRTTSTSGESWSTIAPIDTRRLTAHVEDLLADLTPDP